MNILDKAILEFEKEHDPNVECENCKLLGDLMYESKKFKNLYLEWAIALDHMIYTSGEIQTTLMTIKLGMILGYKLKEKEKIQ